LALENKLNFVGYFEKNKEVLEEIGKLLQMCINLDITVYTTINNNSISIDINVFCFNIADISTLSKAIDVCPNLNEHLKQRE
jgi:hypothetical protein